MPVEDTHSLREDRASLDLLKQRGHRSAVAILLYEPENPPDWEAVALVHSLGHCDYVALILSQIPPAARFLNIDADTERERLSRFAETSNAHSCVLVTDFDIALARLGFEERARLWNNLLHHFPHRRTALLLAMPAGAFHLLPDTDTLTLWTDAGKAILLTEL